VTVTDEEGMQGTVTIPITVNNSAPVLDSMDNATIGTGTTVVASVPFTDLSPIGNDTHTASFDWGDGTSSNAVVRPATRTIEASHTYGAVGNFTAQLTVTDDDNGADTTSVTYGVSSVPATVNVPSASVWSLLAMAAGLLVALLFYRRRTSVEGGR
jgi:PKD repeat protein